MNRETRKANLRKLQLPASGSGRSRRTKTNTTATTTTISDYFATPQKVAATLSPPEINPQEKEKPEEKSVTDSSLTNGEMLNENQETAPPTTAVTSCKESAKPTTNLKRTKLTAFLRKNTDEGSTITRDPSKSPTDDFATPTKVIKKAPRIKKAAATKTLKRASRQPKIKSAFLRNEQLFAEITAQHCIADNVDPDDMQLALAISQSSAEASGELQTHASEEIVVDLLTVEPNVEANDQAEVSLHSKLQKYGFRTSAREDYNNIAAVLLPGAAQRRQKGKWANKFTALTLRNAELQEKKLQKRINAILDQQCKTPPLSASDAALHPYRLLSASLRKCEVQQQAEIVKCPERDAATREEKDSAASTNVACFFVSGLFEVTHLKAGYLLKKWEAIQGRDLSPHARRKQSEVIERRLQAAYVELERSFGKNVVCSQNDDLDLIVEAIQNYVEDADNTNEAKMSTNISGESESTIIAKEPPDKRIKLAETSVDSNPTISTTKLLTTSQKSAGSIHSSLANTQVPSTRSSRVASPDIFDDSDSDTEVAMIVSDTRKDNTISCVTTTVMETPTSSKSPLLSAASSSKPLQAIATVDLTQEEVELVEEQSDHEMAEELPTTSRSALNASCLKVNTLRSGSSFKENTISSITNKTEEADLPANNKCTALFANHNEIMTDLYHKYLGSAGILKKTTARTHSATQIEQPKRTSPHRLSQPTTFASNLHSVPSLQDTQESIDLTFSDSDNEKSCSSDCEPIEDLQEMHLFSNSSHQDLYDSAENEAIMPAEPEFSFVEFIDDKETRTSTTLLKTVSSASCDVEFAPLPTQFLVTPYEFDDVPPASLAAHMTNYALERAEYGILESHSELLTQSSCNSPSTAFTKPLPLESSNTQPCSPESTAPMKRYSNGSSSQKFSQLLHSLEQETPINTISLEDSFDEFDKLIYGSPKRTQNASAPKQPIGMEQLLTAKISFLHDDAQCLELPITPKKSQVPSAGVAAAVVGLELPEELEVNGKMYSVRLATTPKPDFTQQTESELQRQLYKYGIKCLKRKPAVKLLEYIYNQTHPIIMMDDGKVNSPTKADTQSTDIETVSSQPRADNKFNLQDSTVPTLLRYATEPFAGISDEDYILHTNVNKKTLQPPLPLHIAWHNLVCSSTALHEAILMYQCIELQEVWLALKSLGYRYKREDLQRFLDRRCIIHRAEVRNAPRGS